MSEQFDNDYNKGFEQGYRLIKGSNVMLPMIPMAPMTPMGSTAFREGLKKGIQAAGYKVVPSS